MRRIGVSGRAKPVTAACAWYVLLLFAIGCARTTVAAYRPASTDAGDAKPRAKVRTVSIELFKTAERALEQAPDGSFKYGALTDIGGSTCVSPSAATRSQASSPSWRWRTRSAQRVSLASWCAWKVCP